MKKRENLAIDEVPRLFRKQFHLRPNLEIELSDIVIIFDGLSDITCHVFLASPGTELERGIHTLICNYTHTSRAWKSLRSCGARVYQSLSSHRLQQYAV